MHCSYCGQPVPQNSLICPKCASPSTIEVSKIRDTLKTSILGAYLDEHKDIADTWKNLETKAQGNIAIAGIFIAGVFAFLTRTIADLTRLDKWLLVAAIACLSLSVFCAVYALIVRGIALPPLGDAHDDYGARLLDLSDADFLSVEPEFFYDLLFAWRRYKINATNVYQAKARGLYLAQMFLIASVIIAATLTIIKTLR